MAPVTLGLLGASLLVVVAIVAWVPSLRHEASLSLHRKPQPFTALALVDPEPRRSCAVARSRGVVALSLTSREVRESTYIYSARVDVQGAPARTTQGTVTVQPGRAAELLMRVPSARGVPETTGVSVTVTLRGRSQKVILNCIGSSEAGR